jgi:hypothetical protein
MKTQSALNPMVFVKDENDPLFRAYIIKRAKEATDPKNRNKNLSVVEAKARIIGYRKNSDTHDYI